MRAELKWSPEIGRCSQYELRREKKKRKKKNPQGISWTNENNFFLAPMPPKTPFFYFFPLLSFLAVPWSALKKGKLMKWRRKARVPREMVRLREHALA